jgi:hypothetical protein
VATAAAGIGYTIYKNAGKGDRSMGGPGGTSATSSGQGPRKGMPVRQASSGQEPASDRGDLPSASLMPRGSMDAPQGSGGPASGGGSSGVGDGGNFGGLVDGLGAAEDVGQAGGSSPPRNESSWLDTSDQAAKDVCSPLSRTHGIHKYYWTFEEPK